MTSLGSAAAQPDINAASHPVCQIVPPYLLAHLADATGTDPGLAESARLTLQVDAALREIRDRGEIRQPVAGTGGWVVSDAHNTATLPGDAVRDQSQTEESGDAAVDEAWEGVRATLTMFAEVYERQSYDDQDATVAATVHYEKNYANAFWDGERLVCGDGDGRVFGRMTRAIDVLAHELSHAVTQYTANLVYQGQSGALNESISDVFGSCLKQRVHDETADQGDWLIGENLFVEGINGTALRSMKAPGTAYDDPALGKDPQPAHMKDYVETTDDNGGVHLNSGIPNHAFYLAATAIGGSSAEGAGRIWYAALKAVKADVDFAAFAAACVEAAGEHADVVRKAWADVGVEPGATAAEPPVEQPVEQPAGSAAGTPTGSVEVKRTGGLAGLVLNATLDLDSDDPRVPEARELVDRVDFAAPGSGDAYPDAYVYDFRCGDQWCSVPEPHASDDQLRLARLVLFPDE